jgi:hypothetical protein
MGFRYIIMKPQKKKTYSFVAQCENGACFCGLHWTFCGGTHPPPFYGGMMGKKYQEPSRMRKEEPCSQDTSK